jgi:formylglycine-generating enzyme required for sulfatase activity
MMCWPFVFIGLALTGIGAAADASEVPSGHRVALLLGNSRYQDFTLNGVGTSLDRLERALLGQGFRVVRRENLDAEGLKAAVDEFARSVPTAGVAFVYYAGLAGHVERSGKQENLLRPVGEAIGNDSDYRKLGLNVADLLTALRERSGARLSLVFLDACWESPIKPENDNVRGGLHACDVGEDTVAVFAAESARTLPPPKGDEPSSLATALSRHAGRLEDSVRGACEAIAADASTDASTDAAGKPWFAGATDAGIGELSNLPVADTLREGKAPGEGYVNSIGMTFRWCPPGQFTMGSDETDDDAARDRRPVEVTLTQGFWMGEHEVTQREYDVVMRRTVPPGFTQHKNAPFWGVTEAKQVADFCKKLTELERQAGALLDSWEYACPTEAQWEYACRAGSETAYCFGDSVEQLDLYGNFADRALWMQKPDYYWAEQRCDDGVGEALAPVGRYRPNAWGLRDTHGNVAELVADHLLPELPGGADPLAVAEKVGQAVIRGGAWCSLPLYCESSFRNGLPGRDKLNFVGFRVALKRVK